MTDEQIKEMFEAANRRFHEWHAASADKIISWQSEHDVWHAEHRKKLGDIESHQNRTNALLEENNRIMEDVAHSLRVLSGRQRADG